LVCGWRDFISEIKETGGLAAWIPAANDDIFDQEWTWLMESPNGDEPE